MWGRPWVPPARRFRRGSSATCLLLVARWLMPFAEESHAVVVQYRVLSGLDPVPDVRKRHVA
eukprot:8249713-Pyramimonas_sp.AAC.1